ncbi:MAG: hypothetical protein AB3X44_18695 [Leptothrix sp. (in: b-proteobacteria)]
MGLQKTPQRSWTRWMRWFSVRRKKANTSIDFADYGTAFGLDLSMTPDPEPVAQSSAVAKIKTAHKTRPAIG